MAEHAVHDHDVATSDVPAKRKDAHEHYVRPPVDIFDTSDGVVLIADVPGVAKDGLDVSIDADVLTIRGRPSCAAPGPKGNQKFGLPSIFRQFRIGDKIDQDHIAAELKHGVLRLHLPKAEAHKARKVEISAS